MAILRGGKGILLIFLLLPNLAWSYANFIGYGYKSCTTCHYNPFGGGPLNDYGRAVAATAISGKLLYWNASEESLAKYSGAFGSAKLPDWVRPSFDYRSLSYTSDYKGDSEITDGLVMNQELNLVLKSGKRNKFFYSISLSSYPAVRNGPDDGRDSLISRENYFLYKFTDSLSLQAGVFDTVFGLKIPDHEAFSRKELGLDQSDQQLGSAVWFKKGSIEGGLHLFVGNPNEDDSDVQQKGLSASAEFDFGESRIGANLLRSSSEFRDRLIYSVHARVPFQKGNSIIAELGQQVITRSNSSQDITNFYTFFQAQTRLLRGLHWLTTFEFNTTDETGVEQTLYRLGPGIQWFPIQRVELRFEAFNNRAINETNVTRDSWNLFTNVHIYL